MCAIKQRCCLCKVIRNDNHLENGAKHQCTMKNHRTNTVIGIAAAPGTDGLQKFILMFIYTLYSSLIIVTSLSPTSPMVPLRKYTALDDVQYIKYAFGRVASDKTILHLHYAHSFQQLLASSLRIRKGSCSSKVRFKFLR